METGLFKIKSGQGMFEDITQPNGMIVGKQIVRLQKTPRLEEFVRGGGLVEVMESSKEYNDYLESQKKATADQNDNSLQEVKDQLKTVDTAIGKYEGKTNQQLMDEIDERNKDRQPEDQISYTPKSNKAELVQLLFLDDTAQAGKTQ